LQNSLPKQVAGIGKTVFLTFLFFKDQYYDDLSFLVKIFLNQPIIFSSEKVIAVVNLSEFTA